MHCCSYIWCLKRREPRKIDWYSFSNFFCHQEEIDHENDIGIWNMWIFVVTKSSIYKWIIDKRVLFHMTRMTNISTIENELCLHIISIAFSTSVDAYHILTQQRSNINTQRLNSRATYDSLLCIYICECNVCAGLMNDNDFI